MTERTTSIFAERQKRTPLPLPTDNWRSRWLVLRSWRVMHRVAEIEWEGPPLWAEDQKAAGDGVTLCGQRGHLRMPGIFSRMGLKRCDHCCDMMGIPRGKGNPYNEGIYEDGEKPPDE